MSEKDPNAAMTTIVAIIGYVGVKFCKEFSIVAYIKLK